MQDRLRAGNWRPPTAVRSPTSHANIGFVSHVDRRHREWLREEHGRTKRGLAGERDAAHNLENYLKDDPDRMLLHDVRPTANRNVQRSLRARSSQAARASRSRYLSEAE
jgi:hypothetical protein